MATTSSKPVRVRFAPSPTGFLHIGGLRTALYNWLFAKKHGGTFFLRIEDTDRSRLVENSIQDIYGSLQKMGLTPDEGIAVRKDQVVDEGPFAPYLQSARRERHLDYARQLMDLGHAYYCFCTKERLEQAAEQQKLTKQALMYDRHCRNLPKDEAAQRVENGEQYVIRLAVPLESSIVMHDMIRGTIEIPWAQVDDQVLIKSDGFPTYHLAATCDDHDMQVTHVLRAEEWISSLPKHLFISQVFGWEPPEYAHLPLLLNLDRSKLSKRHADVSVKDYLAKGYLPEALINFVALLGWNPTADREVYTKEELAELFQIEKVNRSGAVFNIEKLDWLNAHYLKSISETDYLERCRPWLKELSGNEDLKRRACLIVRERLTKLSDLPELISFMLEESLDYDPTILCWKKQTRDEVLERLKGARAYLNALPEETFGSISELDAHIRGFIISKGWGNGDTLWPLRVALSGKEKSPSPFELLYVYGKERSLTCLDEAITRLA